MKTLTIITACIALALVYVVQVSKLTPSTNKQADRMKLYQAKTDKPMPWAKSYRARGTSKKAVKQAIVSVASNISHELAIINVAALILQSDPGLLPPDVKSH